ncbi:MAG: hypothetical protein ACJ8AW_54700 [Rhodopila sp.]
MIVVDSPVWIAALRAQQTPAVARLLELSAWEPLIVGDLVMTEVLQGARDEAHAERIERNLPQHSVESMVTRRIAVAAARNRHALRVRGHHHPQDDRPAHRHLLH